MTNDKTHTFGTIPDARKPREATMIEGYISSQDLQTIFSQLTGLQTAVTDLKRTITEQRETFLTEERARHLFVTRDEVYDRKYIDSQVANRDRAFEVFGENLDKVVEHVGKLVDEKLQTNRVELDNIVRGFTDETKAMKTGVLNLSDRFTAIEGYMATARDTDRIRAGQWEGMQRELDGIQEENREVRQEVRSVQADYHEFDKRAIVIVEHTNQTRAIVDNLAQALTPVISFYKDEQQRRIDRAKFRKNMREAAKWLITPKGIGAVIGIASTLTGVQLGTGALSEAMNNVLQFLGGL